MGLLAYIGIEERFGLFIIIYSDRTVNNYCSEFKIGILIEQSRGYQLINCFLWKLKAF